MKKALIGFAVACTVLITGGVAIENPSFQHELDELTRRGFAYSILRPGLIEVREEWSGFTRVKSLREPTEAEILAWADTQGVPRMELDPGLIDTGRYTMWYTYWAAMPIAGTFTEPIPVGDLDRNRLPEVYGVGRASSLNDLTYVYEVDAAGMTSLLHYYDPAFLPRQFLDADSDSLLEILGTNGGSAADYEQLSIDSLPTSLSFIHERYEGGLSPGFTGVWIGDLDQDGLTDFLYKGSELDSFANGVSKIYVAEYNQAINNFVRVWSTTFVPGPQSGIGGFAVDDFDSDSLMEFAVVSTLSGTVFITENDGDNSYAQRWQYDTPFVNMYYLTSGDVDGDGKPEIFVGATMSSGNWTMVFEADSNDSYSPRFLFHLLSAGIFDEPTYLTSDLDNDGQSELIIFSGSHLLVFKSPTDDTYELWYYKRFTSRRTMQAYRFFNDDKKSLLICRDSVGALPGLYYYTQIFRPGSALPVKDENPSMLPVSVFLRSHPNPFNTQTHISYQLPFQQSVSLTMYNILGQKVTALIEGKQTAGKHSVTSNAESHPSGLYFCRLITESGSFTTKLLLLR